MAVTLAGRAGRWTAFGVLALESAVLGSLGASATCGSVSGLRLSWVVCAVRRSVVGARLQCFASS
eukprot:scaffold1533_cov388-Prasinococcus_capsulatus_cf.AAC.2